METVISLRSKAVRKENAKVLLHMEWSLMLINDQLRNKFLNLNIKAC